MSESKKRNIITVVIFMIPLSINAVGGLENFVASAPDSYFTPFSAEYPWFWMILWFFVNSWGKALRKELKLLVSKNM